MAGVRINPSVCWCVFGACAMIPLIFQHIISIIFIAAALWLYIMPTLEAHKVRHPQRRAIMMLNLLAGWTFAGWVAAMVWAHMRVKDV